MKTRIFLFQRCIPGFENAAFNADITASNTCGENAPIEFCVQTNPSESRRTCQMCYPGDHNSRYLTDIHSSENQTWWQSETMYEGIQFPNQVNLTLSFGKFNRVNLINVFPKFFETPPILEFRKLLGANKYPGLHHCMPPFFGKFLYL